MDDEIIVETYTKTKSNKKPKKNNKNKQPKLKKKNKVKVFIFLIFLIILLVLLCSSSLFDIKSIEIYGNNRISKEKIISLSKLEQHTNIFRFNKNEVVEDIKENAYIESIKVNRSLPSTVKITVEEREPTYMLQFADSFVYINTQGYMLEISNEKLNVPILVGFSTDLSNIKAGNRINLDDLKKMDMVLKIYETAKSNDIGELISKIDISNEKNYTITLDSEEKVVYLGDASDLNTRILYLKSILEVSKGKKGEIFLNVDLNSQNAYFRPSSN